MQPNTIEIHTRPVMIYGIKKCNGCKLEYSNKIECPRCVSEIKTKTVK